MNTLPAAGMGHNQPPLDELLRDETQALEKRSAELLAAVPRTVVVDRYSAEKATAFAGMIRSHADKIEKAREERKRPYLEAGRTVDAHFQALRAPLIGTDAKRLGGAAAEVIGKIDAYRRQEEAKATAERRRLEEEARLARERQAAAERAQREAEERAQREREESERRIREAEAAARAAGDREAAEKAARERAEAEAARRQQEAAEAQRRLDAEIASGQVAELERQAAAVKAQPIDSGYGVKAFGRKTYRVEITDLTAAIRHARKLNEVPIREAVQSIYDRQARAGVRDLPGATITEDTATTIRKGA